MSPALSQAAPEYTLTKLAALGDAAPGDGKLAIDFEPGGINDDGDVAFGADLNVDGQEGEGVFFLSRLGESRRLARFGIPAEGGGIYGKTFRGPISLNDAGEVAFIFTLEGGDRSTGVYRFSPSTGQITAVMVPGQPVPRGGTFLGGNHHPTINNLGQIVFPAWIEDPSFGADVPPGVGGLGCGILLAGPSPDNEIAPVIRPGDPAPGGKTFDFAVNPSINDLGDIAFGAHVKEDECISAGSRIVCAESVYLRKASGETISIAHQGEDAPGGGKYRLAFGPLVNNQGQVLFIGDLTPAPDKLKCLGVFLFTEGQVLPIARPTDCGNPGTPMPGGGRFVTTGRVVSSAWLNHRGDVSFTATLDSGRDTDGDGQVDVPDQGLFLWSKGVLRAVARTGSMIPEAGELAVLMPPSLMPRYPKDFPWPFSGALLNDRGQILFTAALQDGGGVLVVASPVEPPAPSFRRADANGDGALNLSDAVFTLGGLFLGTEQPSCLDAADSNDDGRVDLSDAVHGLSYLFLGGAAPPDPGPMVCGPDPTPEASELGCLAGCAAPAGG
ncbi:MAG: hypothetical protein HY721_27580 [Planctomycetes bacterium]|nr:hypothetical protein [Planctomycetota bacterium]